MSFMRIKMESIWFGTSNGLNRYDHKESIFIISIMKMVWMQNLFIISKGTISGNLWLSTEKGIIRFSQLSDTTGHSKLLELLMAYLLKKTINIKFIKAKRENICWRKNASGNGFYCFHPDSLKDNDHIPSVVLTELLVK